MNPMLVTRTHTSYCLLMPLSGNDRRYNVPPPRVR